MKITRRDLLAALGAGSAAAIPHVLKGQNLRMFSDAFALQSNAVFQGGANDPSTLPLDMTLNATPAWSLALSGTWRIVRDPDNIGKSEGWFNRGPVLDAIEQQLPNPLELAFPGYNGVVWYWRTFNIADIHHFDDLRIHFLGADYYAEAWLNGQYIGGNQSALLPFAFDITKAIREGENRVVVRVIDASSSKSIDGFRLGDVPGGRQDDNPFGGGWRQYNYGGLLLPVTLQAFRRPWVADAFIKPDLQQSKIHVDLLLIGGGAGEWTATVQPVTITKSGKAAAKSTRTTVSFEPDSSGAASIALSVAEPRLWDIWDPFLYELVLTPKTKGTTWRGTFGMREVSIINHRMAVNGKQFLQRSYLYNQIWPVTLGAPYKDLARRDIKLVRQTNANMLRCFSKTPMLATVEAADEAGILLQPESLGSWYLKNTPAAEVRLANITKRAVLAYRNHPSIFWWNVLNENAPEFPKHGRSDGILGPYVLQSLLGEMHQLDPTRPVIANDPLWGGRNDAWEPGHDTPSDPLHQSHFYPFTELDTLGENYAWLRGRGWGQADNPNAPYRAVTEWGLNSSPVWSQLMQSYRESGVREDAEDYVLYRTMLDWNRHWYEDSGVKEQGFPTFESVGDASREHVAWRYREMMAIYWSNLHCVGHSMTSLEDSSYELSGVVDNWRNPKPVVFETITELNHPLQINLWLRPSSLYGGDELSFDATLVNERQRLPQGDCAVKLHLLDPSGKSVFLREYPHTIGDQPIEHLITDAIVVHPGAGAYRLVAELSYAGQTLRAERPVLIYEKKAAEIKTDRKVWIWDRNETLQRWLTARSLSPAAGNAASVRAGELILALDADPGQLSAVQEAIRRGAHAIFLCPEKFLQSAETKKSITDETNYADLLEPVSGNWKPELRKITWWGKPGAWGYSRTALALSHEFLESLPQAKAFEPQTVYHRIGPEYTWLMTDQPKDLQISHAVRESSLNVNIPYTSDLLSIPVGQGTLVLTSLRIGDFLGIDPAADRILENILRNLTRNST